MTGERPLPGRWALLATAVYSLLAMVYGVVVARSVVVGVALVALLVVPYGLGRVLRVVEDNAAD